MEFENKKLDENEISTISNLRIPYDSDFDFDFLNKILIKDEIFLREMASILRSDFIIVSSDLEKILLENHSKNLKNFM